jgi:hypothetical protein
MPRDNFYKYSLSYGYDVVNDDWNPLVATNEGHLAVFNRQELFLHDGQLFGTGYYNSSVSDASSIELLLTAPAGYDVFTQLAMKSGGDCVLEIYEDVTITSNGTATGVINLHRNKTNTATTTVYHTPTISDYGSLIWQDFQPGGNGNKSDGGSGTFNMGVFARNKSYVLRLTNVSGFTKPMQTSIVFYEHSDGDS